MKPRSWLAALPLLVAALALGWLSLPRGGEVKPVKVECKAGLLIPLYAYPLPTRELLRLREEYPLLPMILIINPSNGPGGKLDAARYAGAVEELREANITVVGYVYTSYTRRPLEEVERDVEKYASWYQLDGMFVDEVTCDDNESHIEYYRSLAKHAESLGLELVIGNPGTWPAARYFEVFDVVVIWENPRYPSPDELARYKSYRDAAAVLVYGQDALDSQALRRLIECVKWVYVTHDDGENPWDALSIHLRSMAKEVAEASAVLPNRALARLVVASAVIGSTTALSRSQRSPSEG